MCFSEPTKITGVKIGNERIRLYSSDVEMVPESSSFVKFYDRDSGKEKKTLMLRLENATFDFTKSLDGINVAIVVDTNTDPKTRKSVSIAMLFLVLNSEGYNGYELNYMGTMVKMFIKKTEVSSEILALNDLLHEIENGKVGYIIDGDNILIFIDHNLGKLNQFNDRVLPLIPDDETSYLPQKVTLAYASSDAKHDSEINEIMAECDRIATLVLNEERFL